MLFMSFVQNARWFRLYSVMAAEAIHTEALVLGCVPMTWATNDGRCRVDIPATTLSVRILDSSTVATRNTHRILDTDKIIDVATTRL